MRLIETHPPRVGDVFEAPQQTENSGAAISHGGAKPNRRWHALIASYKLHSEWQKKEEKKKETDSLSLGAGADAGRGAALAGRRVDFFSEEAEEDTQQQPLALSARRSHGGPRLQLLFPFKDTCFAL